MVDDFVYRHGPCIKAGGSIIMPCDPTRCIDRCIGCEQYESALKHEIQSEIDKEILSRFRQVNGSNEVNNAIDLMCRPELRSKLNENSR